MTRIKSPFVVKLLVVTWGHVILNLLHDDALANILGAGGGIDDAVNLVMDVAVNQVIDDLVNLVIETTVNQVIIDAVINLVIDDSVNLVMGLRSTKSLMMHSTYFLWCT